MHYSTGGESKNETAMAMLERFGGESREEQMELVLYMALFQVVSDRGEDTVPPVSRELLDTSLRMVYDIKEAGGLELNIIDYLLALLGGNEKKEVHMSIPALMQAAEEAGREDGRQSNVSPGCFTSMTVEKAKLALVRKIRGFNRMPGDMGDSMAHAYAKGYKHVAEVVSPN